jgi:hypothetical protein
LTDLYFFNLFRESRYIGDDSPVKIDAKSTLEEHLAVLGNNTCVSIVEVLGISRCFPGKRCCLIYFLTENGRSFVKKRYGLFHATIEFGIADATLPPEEPSLTSCIVVVPAVTVVVVSAIVIPPVTFVVVSAIVVPPFAVVVVSAVVVPPAVVAIVVVSAIGVLSIAVIVPTVKVMHQCAHQQNE